MEKYSPGYANGWLFISVLFGRRKQVAKSYIVRVLQSQRIGNHNMDSVLDSSCRGTHQVPCTLQPMRAMEGCLLLSRFVFGDPKHSLKLSKLIFGAAVWRGTKKTGNRSIASESYRWALVTSPQQLRGDQAKDNNNNKKPKPTKPKAQRAKT